MKPGFVLDVGCGIGRNLEHLDGHGVGIDHNADCVAACVAKGLMAFTPDDFAASEFAADGRFDSILVAHVLEHMTEADAVRLLRDHLRYIKRGGAVIVITPQERGQRSDATHVHLVDPASVRRIADAARLRVEWIRSFPFSPSIGKVFTHNETVSLLRRL